MADNNVCARCDLPRVPYGAAVPTEDTHLYCWGSTSVGIDYCLTHHGTRNEDEDGMCNWFDPNNEDHVAECQFVHLRHDHFETATVVKWEA